MKPKWIETPAHLGGGWSSITVPSSCLFLTPAGPEFAARLMMPEGGSKDLVITDYDDTQHAMNKAWDWAMNMLNPRIT